ncbi:hypothetical protein GUJ93_ZPchr0010g9623 [Zizania palustris]|uniref:Uncharacterized protein n=1 Tax=Zizania palustris TaxID=103762 RepID=A0A8J5WAW6_ZIZPA|nr:hypothetical protein GUJ93_ZPchr0010g9623 [Zizania palustris]
MLLRQAKQSAFTTVNSVILSASQQHFWMLPRQTTLLFSATVVRKKPQLCHIFSISNHHLKGFNSFSYSGGLVDLEA